MRNFFKSLFEEELDSWNSGHFKVERRQRSFGEMNKALEKIVFLPPVTGIEPGPAG